jgi:hypothetical protein
MPIEFDPKKLSIVINHEPAGYYENKIIVTLVYDGENISSDYIMMSRDISD